MENTESAEQESGLTAAARSAGMAVASMAEYSPVAKLLPEEQESARVPADTPGNNPVGHYILSLGNSR